jgi:hypothetical protein
VEGYLLQEHHEKVGSEEVVRDVWGRLLAEPGSIRVFRAETDDLKRDDDMMTRGSSDSDAEEPRGDFESREVADRHGEGYGYDTTATEDSNAEDAED